MAINTGDKLVNVNSIKAVFDIEKNSRHSADNALSSRIDNIVTPQGDASLTEVVDARTDQDGTVYASLKARIDAVSIPVDGLSDNAKTALLNCFSHVAWADAYGQSYYNALEVALNNGNTYPCIRVTYVQGSHVIRAGDSLVALKTGLTVTHYTNASTYSILSSSDYTLSGTLTTGLNAVTVTYGDLQNVFYVTAIADTVPSEYTSYDYIGVRPQSELSGVTGYNSIDTQNRLKFNSGIAVSTVAICLQNYTDLWNLDLEFSYKQHTLKPGTSAGAFNVLFGGRYNNDSSKICGFYKRIDGERLSFQTKGLDLTYTTQADTNIHKIIISVDNTNKETKYYYDGELAQTYDFTSQSNTSPERLILFNSVSTNNYTGTMTLGILNYLSEIIVRNPNTHEIINDYVPVKRNSDNVIGIYDTVGGHFYTTGTTSYATIGNTNCIYAVGNW